MPSSDRLLRAAAALALALSAAFSPREANAAPAPGSIAVPGFGVDRLYTSAPGGGWFVMDTLDMHGGLGSGAISLGANYANQPLRIASSDGSVHLPVVSSELMTELGASLVYERFRVSFDFTHPLVVTGRGATLGPYTYSSPRIAGGSAGVDPGTSPDGLTDSRVGFDARILGSATSAFRLGAGAQLFVPSGDRSAYTSDGTYRAMGRVLVAGDVGRFSYAGQLGVHIRPLDDTAYPGSPRGSELLFGAAAGAKFPLGGAASHALVVGPEIYGETALSSFFGASTTGVEGLLSARFEGTRGDGDGPQLRVKLGFGPGLDAAFGVPEWRLVAGVELFQIR